MTLLKDIYQYSRSHSPGAVHMIQSNRNSHEEIANRLADTQGVQQALKRAVTETIRDHARSGHKIVVWRDNQVVWEDVSLSIGCEGVENNDR